MNLITTPTQGGPSVAKDMIKRPGLKLDLGAYVSQDYEKLQREGIDPQVKVGSRCAPRGPWAGADPPEPKPGRWHDTQPILRVRRRSYYEERNLPIIDNQDVWPKAA